jgi:siroheme decarboxylase
MKEYPMVHHSPVASNTLDFQLLNGFQRNFPLVPRPFAELARELDTTESKIITRLQRLQDHGAVSRVGPVFRPNAIGVSALAALTAPPERLGEIAQYVSAQPEVNHNYEREHAFNLWFVVAAPALEPLKAVLRRIERECNCGPVLYLPMLEEYHIDLGFDLLDAEHGKAAANAAVLENLARDARAPAVTLDQAQQELVAALQDGLPIVPRPFNWLGMPEAQALPAISRWVDEGIIKRFGIIVRHRELGYTANAMVVWDVPDADVSRVGAALAASGRVSLCYLRARQLPHWRYNLFCMIHGKDRDEVQVRIDDLIEQCGLQEYQHAVLFSRRRFKQRGARYVPTEEQHGSA